MTYSTCSLNPLENEAVVAQLLLRSQGAASRSPSWGTCLVPLSTLRGWVGGVCGGGGGLHASAQRCVHRTSREECPSFVQILARRGAALHCTALHCTALHCTALHCNGHAQLELCSTQRTRVIPRTQRISVIQHSAHIWQQRATVSCLCQARSSCCRLPMHSPASRPPPGYPHGAFHSEYSQIYR